MRRLLALTAAAAAFAAGHAFGDILPPIIAATLPLHPSSHERFGIVLIAQGLPGPIAGLRTLGRASLRSGTIEVDFVVTDVPDQFPGYRLVGDPKYDVLAWVGPLAPGVYPIYTHYYSHSAAGDFAYDLFAQSVEVADTAGPVALVDAVEFYNTARDRYFLTADADEAALLDGGLEPGWRRTGQSFKMYRERQSDGRGRYMCRFASIPSGLDSHFLTVNAGECDDVLESGAWQPEYSATEAGHPDTLSGECPDRMLPVYRLWNPRNGDHRWTTDSALRADLIARGWIPEGYGNLGIAMCAPQA